ncbi:MAG: hypothetical protein JSS51_12980 [Planctomycetes bacterium]|nr:hypothetical protein [Planctomycetota bacterium]
MGVASTPMTNPTTAHPARRRFRRFLIAVAIVLGCAVGGYYALTQGFVGRWIIESILSRRVGAIASLRSIHFHKSGRTDLYGLKFRVPDVPGKPGTFFEAERLEVDLDMTNWMRGEIGLQAVAAEGIIARISQDMETDSVNIQSWRPPSGTGLGRLPRVVVRSGKLEFCENKGRELTVLKSFDIKGEVAPEDADTVLINFKELRREPDGREVYGMAVGGKILPTGVELVLTSVSLTDWPAESVPTKFRSIFQDLALSGQITRTRLQYSFRRDSDGKATDPIEGFAATLEFTNLGVSLPGVTEQQTIVAPLATTKPLKPGDASRLMRIQADRGTITFAAGRTEAKLNGNVEGVPYTVQAIYKGTNAQSPFEAVFTLGEFDLRRDSTILRFATPLVLERLQDFNFPEGKVKAQVVVSRAEGKDIQTRGEVRLREGVAAFFRFPYQFQNIRALVTFTSDEVIIQRVEGTAPSGATIVADGRIAPPVEDAGVVVNVRAERVPIDDTLAQAMGPKRSKIIKRVFNKDRYDELLAKGEIRSPQTPANPDDPDAPPAFALGGTATIGVHVTRDEGPGTDPWHDKITIDLANAGLLPEKFPYPLVGDSVQAVITDGMLHLEQVALRGLNGGDVRITADFDASRRPDDAPDPDPTVRVTATDVPVDRLLVQALPSKDVGGRSARSVVSALGLTGTIDAAADIGPRNQDIGVRVEVTPRQLDAVPRLVVPAIPREDVPLAGEVVLRGLAGKIVSDEEKLLIDLTGSAAREAPSPNAQPPCPFRLHADADLSNNTPTIVEFDAARLDLSLPLEGVLSIIAPAPAATISELRDSYDPAGMLNLRVRANVLRDQTDATVDLSAFEGARILLPSIPGATESAEVSITGSSGAVRILPGDRGRPTAVQFTDFRANVFSGQTPDGTLQANGTAALLRGALAHPPTDPSSLRLEWRGAQLGSPLCRWIGASVLGELAGDLHERHDPQGLFDLSLSVVPGKDKPELRGEFRPHSLRLTMSDGVVDFPRIDGAAQFDRRSVTFNKAVLDADKWNVAVSGGWKRDDSGRSEGSAHLAIDSLGIPADLVAAAPAGVCDALRDLKVNATGKVLIPSLDVKAWWDTPSGEESKGRPDRLRASGRLVIEGGSADVGIEVTQANGAVDFEATREGRDAPLRYDMTGSFTDLRLSGIELTNAQVRVVSGDRPGETFVPLLSGDCYGGRLTGQASVFPTGGTSPPDSKDFDVRIALSGVTLGPLVEDVRRKLATDPASGNRAGSDSSTAASAARSSARLDVGFGMTGTLGRPETRRGRGTASAGQGTLVSLPLLLRLVEASNLMLPLGEPLDLLQASFFVQDHTVSFEELSIFSSSVEFLGFGTLTWPNMELDMIFTHRATYRLPIVGHIVESLRNELVTTTVGGTLANPSFGVSTMRGTRGFLERIFGGPTDAQSKRMAELEARGRRGSERVRILPGGSR